MLVFCAVLGNHDYRGNVEAQLSPVLQKIDNRWLCQRSFILNTGMSICQHIYTYLYLCKGWKLIVFAIFSQLSKWLVVIRVMPLNLASPTLIILLLCTNYNKLCQSLWKMLCPWSYCNIRPPYQNTFLFCFYLDSLEIAEFFFVDTTPFVDDYYKETDHKYDWRGVSPRRTYITNLLKVII